MYDTVAKAFQDHFGHPHTVASYAPGRVEVLGNHTDYNEGFVLSAAINFGTYFLASPSEDTTCRIVAGDLMAEVSFDVSAPNPVTENTWANYVIGVLAGLQSHGEAQGGFNGMFLGNIPLGAGLSSSAALEMCTGLALGKLYGIEVEPLEMAKIGQKAEHEHAGVKCGLLDQVSSLFGQENALVMTDFRSLEVQTLPMGDDAAFLMCNTKAKHALVDGEYNERREHCEGAAAYFKGALSHPVAALRDVSWAEWEAHESKMPALAARRAAHPIGESERVLKGRQLLDAGDLAGFGKLMFDSHDSSANYFENSCPELDTIVNAAKGIPGVLGARLSGGGFGGSVVALIHPRDAETVAHAINAVFEKAHGHPCDISVITPSAGARIVG
ncbi:MAG: galactokinase [Kiritimatiellia bacterium]|jgi:galactokinase|nr:galactokinase [Kiritimatiellia bacterium]MDP6811118.1 galactokinase [Kiritimatiellia bacterium]MDP7024421.1 galactokinase [Kiritimatiellia bacterium]